ncbi:Dyp-type peroxidase domain-containing protein, partial [Enterobacter hormaechei]
VLASTDDLIKNTAIREIERTFTCNVAIGHRVWKPLVGTTPPRELQPFREIKGATHTAVSTPGDLLYHIRARTMDLIVAFERNLLMAFGDAVETVDD